MTGEREDLEHHRTIPGSKSPYLLIPTQSLFILYSLGAGVEKTPVFGPGMNRTPP